MVTVDGHPCIGRGAQLAIRFGVLTAARQAEVRRATWEEFDFESAVWTVPAAHMKRFRPHRVPLSTGVLAVLGEARGVSDSGFAFHGPQGQKLGRTAMANALRAAISTPWGTDSVQVLGTGRATRGWTNCYRSSRWRMSKARKPWRRTDATTCCRSGARLCKHGPTSSVRRATDTPRQDLRAINGWGTESHVFLVD